MFARLLMIIDRFRQEERGAALVEYGLLVALIALVCILAVTALGSKISAAFSAIADAVVT